MIAPIVDIEIIKLACVLAFLVPVVMISGAGFLWGVTELVCRLLRIR